MDGRHVNIKRDEAAEVHRGQPFGGMVSRRSLIIAGLSTFLVLLGFAGITRTVNHRVRARNRPNASRQDARLIDALPHSFTTYPSPQGD
jgi:hypothetical protein